LTAATALLEKLPALDGRLITADPLHNQRKHARTIVEKGGDYLFQIKENQPRLFKQAQGLDALHDTPFLPTPRRPTDGWKSAGCIPSPSNR
jgi:predicted transposase YbfD/YdcC